MEGYAYARYLNYTSQEGTASTSLRRWCPLALRSDPRPEDVEQNGHREKYHTDERQKTGRPWYTEFGVHCMCKQWKESARERADEGIDRDGAVGIEAIAVDEVAHSLPERHHATKSEKGDGEHLRYPRDVWIASPGEPE